MLIAIWSNPARHHPRCNHVEAVLFIGGVEVLDVPLPVALHSNNLCQYRLESLPGHSRVAISRPPLRLACARSLSRAGLRNGRVAHHGQPPQKLGGGILQQEG